MDDLAVSYLVLNPGSSTLKYSLFDSASLALLEAGKIERWDGSSASALHELALSPLLQAAQLQGIGCRVVHGGATFSYPTIVTPEVLATIRSLSDLAPLHNPAAANLIEVCLAHFVGIPVIAVFDTAFHSTLPQVAHTYAIPRELARSHNLHRFGFHGIAHQYVSARMLHRLGLPAAASRLITCHLGSGTSICAIKDGISIDTSMGFTPMEGLVMGTRSGDIDPGLVLHLIQNLGISVAEVHSILNHQGGLLGISGISADMREVEIAASSGDQGAELALECFAYRAVKYIGAYYVTLEGIDAIAFSGGIGENSADMRSRICRRLGALGVRLDPKVNAEASGERESRINNPSDKVSVWVIHADEERQIATQLLQL